MEHLTRYDKAQRILDSGMVHPVHVAAGDWRVDSESDPDVSYRVNVQAHTCECPDAARGHVCKHQLACEKAQEIYNRPVAVAHPRTLEAFTAWAVAP